MINMIFLVIGALFFISCSAPKPAAVEYRINMDTITTNFDKSTCRDKSLKIAEAFSPSYLMSLNINYVLGKNKQFAYSQSKWASAPNRFIGAEVEKLLRDMSLFKTVQTSKSRTKSDYILETNVEEFMQYFDADSTKSDSKVVIVLSLIDSASSQVIASKSFSSQIESKTLNAEGGVEALSLAFKNVLQESTLWFEELCH